MKQGNKNNDVTDSNSHPVQYTAKCVCWPLEIFQFFFKYGTRTWQWKCCQKFLSEVVCLK